MASPCAGTFVQLGIGRCKKMSGITSLAFRKNPFCRTGKKHSCFAMWQNSRVPGRGFPLWLLPFHAGIPCPHRSWNQGCCNMCTAISRPPHGFFGNCGTSFFPKTEAPGGKAISPKRRQRENNRLSKLIFAPTPVVCRQPVPQCLPPGNCRQLPQGYPCLQLPQLTA